jgi:hypothetical protein
LLKHFTIGGLSEKSVPFACLRCQNPACVVKSFTHYEEEHQSELNGRSIYSKSSHDFVTNKLSKRAISYNDFKQQIAEDYGTNTSICTLYTWVQKAKLVESKEDLSDITILNTDEKHPFKKSSANNNFIIVSAGKNEKLSSAVPLYLIRLRAMMP